LVARRNRAGADTVPSLTTNPDPSEWTMPVGEPGTMTRKFCGTPSASYTFERSISFTATHQGPVELDARPHPFRNSRSSCSVGRDPSDSK